jgi:hypothetical protein
MGVIVGKREIRPDGAHGSYTAESIVDGDTRYFLTQLSKHNPSETYAVVVRALLDGSGAEVYNVRSGELPYPEDETEVVPPWIFEEQTPEERLEPGQCRPPQNLVRYGKATCELSLAYM